MKTNVHAFKRLIKLYESITIEDCQEGSPCDLTGYGSTKTCSLCKSIGFTAYNGRNSCERCLHSIVDGSDMYSCLNGASEGTYDEIERHQDDAYRLYHAFKDRAKYLRSVLTNLKYKQP